MEQVLKYPLPLVIGGGQQVLLPEGSRVLAARRIGPGNTCYLWVLGDLSAAPVARCFHIISTGDSPPPNSIYLDTLTSQSDKGWFAVHVFEEVECDGTSDNCRP